MTQTRCANGIKAASRMKPSLWLWIAAGFIVLSFLYYGWMTGFTFVSSELWVFPNYDMLAKSFLNGRLDLLDNPPEDYSFYGGKKYLYFGPVPALFHMVSAMIGWQISTGLMIVLLTAGTSVVFTLILVGLNSNDMRNHLGPLQIAFVVMFAINGFTLWMVSVPSIHHEAISSAIFFLLLGIYLVLKAARNSFTVSISDGLMIGLSLSLSLGSRSSYILTVALLVVFMLWGISCKGEGRSKSKSLVLCAIIGGIPLCSLLLLLAYNYARFGSLAEFGMRYAKSLYSEYLLQGYFFRYDHIPYNLWSYMFYIPEGTAHFPFVKLPFCILRVESVAGAPYILLHANELCSSVFCFLPVLLFCFVPVFKQAANQTAFQRSALRLFAAVFVLQMLPLSMSMAAITRYYYDFLPMLILIAFLGMEQVQEEFQHKNFMLVIISAISILFSFAVVVNAVRFHEAFSLYRSPLLNFF